MRLLLLSIFGSVLLLAPVAKASDVDWIAQFRNDVARCWNVGALDGAAQDVSVTLVFGMNPDGTPKADEMSLKSYDGGTELAAAEAYEIARRAIIRCGKDGYDLPRDKHDHWRDIEMTFNPEKMRIK